MKGGKRGEGNDSGKIVKIYGDERHSLPHFLPSFHPAPFLSTIVKRHKYEMGEEGSWVKIWD